MNLRVYFRPSLERKVVNSVRTNSLDDRDESRKICSRAKGSRIKAFASACRLSDAFFDKREMLWILCGLSAILAVSFDGSHGKPLESGVVSVGIEEVADADHNVDTNTDVVRQQRSPGFGFLKDYDDYSYDDFSGPRHSKFGHKHKHPHFHHKPHGCRGYGCGGHQPDYGDYYDGGHGIGQSGSFASASAGSQQGGFHGGQSQANAQSASFNFGPYSASFSVAQSSSGH